MQRVHKNKKAKLPESALGGVKAAPIFIFPLVLSFIIGSTQGEQLYSGANNGADQTQNQPQTPWQSSKSEGFGKGVFGLTR